MLNHETSKFTSVSSNENYFSLKPWQLLQMPKILWIFYRLFLFFLFCYFFDISCLICFGTVHKSCINFNIFFVKNFYEVYPGLFSSRFSIFTENYFEMMSNISCFFQKLFKF